ncbi:MAG: hypothetical protein KDB14_12655 [Planctomycetales bacterium]|nr:hypothetical protein [Planctomycetales bacterium]
MARSRRGRRTDHDAPYELVDEDNQPRSRRSRRSKKKRSWLSKIVVLLLLAAAFVAALPTIVTRTPLRNTVLAWASSATGLQIEATGLRGGWLNPTGADGLVVRDSDGQPLLEAEKVDINRTLIALIQNQQDLGTIQLQKPVAHVALRPDGNNWLDALQPLMQGSSSSAMPRVEVVVNDGAVQLQDARQLQRLELSQLQLKAKVDDSAETALQGEAATLLTNSQGQAGELRVRFDATNMSLSDGQASLESAGLPLTTLQPLLSAYAPHLQAVGDANGRAQLKWSRQPDLRAQLALDGLDIRNLELLSTHLPPTDAVRLAQLTGQGQLQWENGKLSAQDLELKSDVASLSASGRVELSHLTGDTVSLSQDDELRLASQVDVARLAGMLPATLRIRSDTHIDSGIVQATLDSRIEQGQRVWHGQLNSSQLAATTAGHTVRWEQPVSVEFDALQQPHGWSIRKLDCLSSFLKLSGSGNIGAGRVDLEGNLDRLKNELSQFVDLGDIQLAGVSKGFVHWQQGAQGVVANGQIDLTQFQVVLPNRAPLVEPQLTLLLAAQGKPGPDGSLASLDQAKLTVQAGDDRLSAELLQPVSRLPLDGPLQIGLPSQAAYPIRLQVSGDLGRWTMRTAVLAAQPNLRGDGAIEFDGELVVSRGQFVVSKSTLDATPCRISGLGVPIDEPQLKANIIGTYDLTTGRWVGGESTLVSATFAARCNNLLFVPSGAGASGSISGDIAYRGSLPRILRLLNASQPDRRYDGELEGRANLVQQNGTTQFTVQQRLKDFAIHQRDTSQLRTTSAQAGWHESWAEPQLDLNTKGVYSPAQDTIQFEQLQIGLDSAQLAVSGQISDLSNRLQANLQGELAYNLQRLTNKLHPLTGNSIALEGESHKPITIRGPLRSAVGAAGEVAAGDNSLLPMDLLATAGFQWDSAVIEGFRIGPGEINTSLEQATIRFDSMQIPVSQGKLLLAPQISFRTASPILTVPPGPVVENLLISEEMTSTWMKYVAPALADATRVQGSFSASVSRMSVPMTNPRAGELQGTLTIHRAQAGPGPLAQQLLGFVTQVGNIVKGAGEGANNVNLDRALQLLGNGNFTNEQGRFDLNSLSGLLPGNAGSAQPAGANAVWLQIPEHEVKYHVAQERVFHEGMRFQVDNVEVRTTGSVGLDESLDLVAELPIPEKWIGDAPALASLRGQSLRVPVRGTVRQPRLDQTAVRQLTQQLVRDAARGALNNVGGSLNQGINGAFNQVFGPGPASQGGVPIMTPTGTPALNPNAPAQPGAAPAQPGAAPAQPGAAQPANPLQDQLNRAINNGFNRLFPINGQ